MLQDASPLADRENIENICCTSLDLQLGQTTFPVVTSISIFSNTFPHLLHLYSLIGNVITSYYVNYDADFGMQVSRRERPLEDSRHDFDRLRRLVLTECAAAPTLLAQVMFGGGDGTNSDRL